MRQSTIYKVELFKRKNFEIFTTLDDGRHSKKQELALELLTDDTTTELLYGGAAGGAKSFTIFLWETLMCLAYPETHYFVAREVLKDLRLYGMQTFSEVAKKLRLEESDYNYNASDNVIHFYNKSKIYLLECKKKPSDTEFHGLGSSLFTAGAIEEAGEVHFDAFDTLKTRVGRWNNDKYGIKGKIFITSNPAKNWLYNIFYKPYTKNELKESQKFIPALVQDNIFGQSEYEENLRKIKDKTRRERLLKGNWEYDDDPSKLLEYDEILDLFTNPVPRDRKNKYISCDIARKGKDKTVACVWHGLVGVFRKKNILEQSLVNETVALLERIEKEEGIQRSHQVLDQDGIGGGVCDYHTGCKDFVNNAQPIKTRSEKIQEKRNNTIKQNYINLKTQCAFKFAELAREGKIRIECDSEDIKNTIISELEQLKQANINKEGKIAIIKKEEMKELLGGRSPDFLDCFVGDTLIQTTKGLIKIEDIKIGDKVITPNGTRKVMKKKCRKSNELIKLKTNNGKVIYFTPNHEIYINNMFTTIDNITMRAYNEVEIFSLFNLIKWRLKRLLNTKVRNTGFHQPTLNTIIPTLKKMEKEQRRHYIEEFGKMQTEESLMKESAYTILMETLSIIRLIIYKQFVQENIAVSMLKSGIKIIKNLARKIFLMLGFLQVSGINQKKEKNGTQDIQKKYGKNQEDVLYAKNYSWLEKMRKPNAVQEIALVKCEETKVYDITVQKDHCYYANDILVSNCILMRMYFELKPKVRFYCG